MSKSKRETLKELVEVLPLGNQIVFRRMYGQFSSKDKDEWLSMDLNIIIDNIPNKNIDWATSQCYQTFIRKLTK